MLISPILSVPHTIPPPPTTTTPSDPTRIRFFLNVLVTTPLISLDATLASLPPLKSTASEIEEILSNSYSHPESALKFFVWSGQYEKHSQFSYNLIVDILGKNGLFEPMWDAIRNMKQESLLSTATFASAFGSYCSAGKIKEAIMTFDVMDRYNVKQDVVAMNTLLSSICGQGRTIEAADFFDRIKGKVVPDKDTFAILLEGWEKLGNVVRAKTTFGEMIIRVGWSKDNMSAYDAFLTTLVKGGQSDEAIKFLNVMKGKECLPGLKFFTNALDILVRSKDVVHALALWYLMVIESGLIPNLVMCNAIVGLVCSSGDFESAFRILDAMPFYGAFPDSLTYNLIFECLVQNRKKQEAEKFFEEMRKNETVPSPSNCTKAVKLFFQEFDPVAAVEIWNYVLEAEERKVPDDEFANELLVGFAKLKMWNQVRKYADDMLDIEVNIKMSTLDILKVLVENCRNSYKDYYDHIARRVERRLKR